MKLCDRCRVSGCCLNYLGEACQRARERECPDVVYTNGDVIRDADDKTLAILITVATHGTQPDKIHSEDLEELIEYLKKPAGED